MDKSRVRKVSDILASYFDSTFVKKADGYNQFYKSWAYFAGEKNADHSRIDTIRNGILVVSVDHPAWIPLLQMKQHDILEKVKKQFPDLGIKGISFRIQPERYSKIAIDDSTDIHEMGIGEIHQREEDSDDIHEGSLNEAKTIQGIEMIKDEGLKAALERLGQSIKKKNREDIKHKV